MSGAHSRNKGVAAEKAVARWLTANGWPTKRRLAGNGQAGDLMIADAPDVVVDVKDRQQLAVSAWLDQLDLEAAGRAHTALVVKVAGCSDPGEWVAVCANEPHAYFRRHIQRPRTLESPSLDLPTWRNAVGWLNVEHTAAEQEFRTPALYWQDNLLMRLSSFAECLLPEWAS